MKWHHPFLEALGIPSEKLPRPLPSQSVAGEVTVQAAELTGLKPGTPVIAVEALGSADVLAEGEGLMVPAREDAFTDAVLELLADSEQK